LPLRGFKTVSKNTLTKLDHADLGQVEIGGWKTRFTRQNPPTHLLKGEIEKYVPWMLWLAEISPRIVIKEVSTEFIEKSKIAKITVLIENEGYLPTNITQRALDAKIASPVRVLVDLKDAELISGKKRVDIGHLNGKRGSQGDSADSKHTVEYIVRVTGKNPSVSVTVQSEKGGTVRKDIAVRD